jgi:hypothetical protein
MAAHNLRGYLPFIGNFDCVGKHIAVIVWAGLFVHIARLHIDVNVVGGVFGWVGKGGVLRGIRHKAYFKRCTEFLSYTTTNSPS